MQRCVENIDVAKSIYKISISDVVVVMSQEIDKDRERLYSDAFDVPVLFVKYEDNLEEVPYKIENIIVNAPKKDDKTTVLLIDDSVVQLRMLNEILKIKYKVMMATSCSNAFIQIKMRTPDIIILDYEMPDVDGRETFIRLKENQTTKNIPVVFLTGLSDKKHISNVLELKPAGYLLKPVNAEKLISTIEGLMN